MKDSTGTMQLESCCNAETGAQPGGQPFRALNNQREPCAPGAQRLHRSTLNLNNGDAVERGIFLASFIGP